MRKLEPGTNVRIEHNAQIVGLVDKDNPYWYEVEYPTGEHDTVSLARINAVVDKPRMVIDTDCSIQIFSPRLSASGALDLLLWLETHRTDFEQVVIPPLQPELCSGCHQPFPDAQRCTYRETCKPTLCEGSAYLNVKSVRKQVNWPVELDQHS